MCSLLCSVLLIYERTTLSLVKGIVLDLRNNSGGKLQSAIKVASLFVPKGTYLGSSVGNGRLDKLYPDESYYASVADTSSLGNADSFDDYTQLIDTDKTHVVILTDHKTASASEFLTGVFQDLDLGLVVGIDATTLGKGIGQRELPVGDGALKLTYHEFHTPSGRCVQRRAKNDDATYGGRAKKVLRTANGRDIVDRNGISVDYKITTPKNSILSALLSKNGVYFEFATQWDQRWKSTPDESTFQVDDTIYNEFCSFVEQRQRDGSLHLESMFDDQSNLDTIESMLLSSSSSSFSSESGHVSSLSTAIINELLDAFVTDKEEVMRELEKNILSRHIPDSKLIARGLKKGDDVLVKEAMELLEDNTMFNHLIRR